MYAKARAGQITGFTGIDDPYEPPTGPEITLDTVAQTAESNAWKIIHRLADSGFVRPLNTERTALKPPSAPPLSAARPGPRT